MANKTSMKTPIITLRYKIQKPNKKGLLPLVLVISYSGKAFRKGLGIAIEPNRLSGLEISGKDRETVSNNIKIRDTVSDLQRKFYNLADQGLLTIEKVKAALSGEQADKLSFTELFSRVEKIYAGILSEGRLAGISSAVVKFDKWSKKIPINQISAETMTRYESFLRSVTKNKPNSINADMKDLSSLINKGLKHKLILNNPFVDYSIPAYNNPKRMYLTRDEVELIEQYADNPSKNSMLRLVAAWFVLGCRSGLRYSDMQKWSPHMVQGDKLYFSDVKEGTPHYVPIKSELKGAIERITHLRSIPENQVCNRWLKEICESETVNISKNVTMHTSRHTFAVNYLDSGGSQDVLRKLLGHRKIETTGIYGQITDKRIDEETSRVFR